MLANRFPLGRLALVALLFSPGAFPRAALLAAEAESTPTVPADYRSNRFLIHTDVSPQEAQELLVRLETMLSLLEEYWGRPSSGVIECFVVRDLANWPEGSLDPDGRDYVAAGAGLTRTFRLTSGNQFLARSIVYAVAEHGTPQHEAVHAYCQQTFGDVGPVWYSEGMAEMGQYWREGDASVNCRAEVIDYLRAGEPQTIDQIIHSEQFTGDSWQNYAWRWALCHLLDNNENYRDRFRPLGLAFLNQRSASFEEAFGDVADQITFEYLFFLEHLEQGYRVDLCSWDWKRKFRRATVSTAISSKIHAARGWQASGAIVEAASTYRVTAKGTWTTSAGGEAVDAGGSSQGTGRLAGVIFDQFELGEPFDLGADTTFVAPRGGRLYLRCTDDWAALADNDGQLTVKVRAE